MHRLAILCISLLLCACDAAPKTTVERSATPTAAASLVASSILDTSKLSYVMGKFNPEVDTAFIPISENFADRAGMYLQKEAYDSYLKMYAAAKEAGINLQIRSATRNFDYQKGIWERKWTGETKLSSGEDASKAFQDSVVRAKNILKYSSMPGTSRHHWGTDIDLNNFNNEWFETGEGLKLFQWLEAHAHEYGYCRPYTAKDADRPNGYNEEKWHWSYTPISNEYTLLAEKHLKDNMIVGFKGSGVAGELEVVKNYVLGINHGCRH